VKLGIREQLFLISILVILIVGVATGAYLEQRLQSWLESRIETELLRYAQSARAVVADNWPLNLVAADLVAAEFGDATATRITIIDRTGRVIGDSEVGTEDLATVDNHGDRPEVRMAFRDGMGVGRRHSATIDADLLYVAVPFGNPPQGVVRAARHLSDVDKAIHELHLHLILAGFVGLMVAVLMSGTASHLFTRTLRSLVSHARTASRGNGTERAHSRGDIARLAGSFQQLAQNLEQQMTHLANERDRSNAILDCMSEALLVLDRQQEITLANRAAVELFESPLVTPGEPLSDAVGGHFLHEMVMKAQEGGVVDAEFELRSPVPRHILARAAPLRLSGGCVVVLHDITELRRIENFLREFVANASHELRTPVSVIRANSEALLDGALANPTMAPRLVEALHRNAERLARIIADLLDLSQLDAREYRLKTRPVALDEAVLRAIEALAQPLAEKGLQVHNRIREGIWVYADEKALDQILMNLLDNAMKYTPEQGTIWISDHLRGQQVRIEIEDTGPGIAEEHRKRVFERFYRVDTGRSRELGGTGLGLAIVKDLAGAMGGTVGVESRDPNGSIFWVSFPYARSERLPQEAEDPPPITDTGQ